MTRIDKLYARILASPGSSLTFREFEKLLRAFGFEHGRTTGSHMIWVHPQLTRPLPVQRSGKEAKPYQVREFLELIEEHGLYIGA
ncbi:type II toxin-antitoxin system HicA family toxin [Qipengyuania sp.]|uniref:type II toxin-antitoxin system HicA family toxin n=1 Tax=Qipengyuania sp. TaxID=2004515 RepID=UPI00373589AB